MAQSRVIVDEAYPGDIIGIQDPGIFSIGDTICADDSGLQYDGIPSFAPEHFAKVGIKNSLKRKQFLKGITQISEEGQIQVYKRQNIGIEELIIGVVGVLQFDILDFRLKNEYGVEAAISPLPYNYIRWIADGYDRDTFQITMDTLLALDKNQDEVLLFQNEWSVRQVIEKNAGKLKLSEISGVKIK